jgi:hypothetical protein
MLKTEKSEQLSNTLLETKKSLLFRMCHIKREFEYKMLVCLCSLYTSEFEKFLNTPIIMIANVHIHR